MQAVIKTGGKQYSVAEGDVILVELLGDTEAGKDVSFDEVLMVTGDTNKIGTPMVEGASVKGTVITEVKGPKTRSLFFRRRHDSRTTKGHRQNYHKVKITKICA